MAISGEPATGSAGTLIPAALAGWTEVPRTAATLGTSPASASPTSGVAATPCASASRGSSEFPDTGDVPRTGEAGVTYDGGMTCEAAASTDMLAAPGTSAATRAICRLSSPRWRTGVPWGAVASAGAVVLAAAVVPAGAAASVAAVVPTGTSASAGNWPGSGRHAGSVSPEGRTPGARPSPPAASRDGISGSIDDSVPRARSTIRARTVFMRPPAPGRPHGGVGSARRCPAPASRRPRRAGGPPRAAGSRR